MLGNHLSDNFENPNNWGFANPNIKTTSLLSLKFNFRSAWKKFSKPLVNGSFIWLRVVITLLCDITSCPLTYWNFRFSLPKLNRFECQPEFSFRPLHMFFETGLFMTLSFGVSWTPVTYLKIYKVNIPYEHMHPNTCMYITSYCTFIFFSL